MLRLLFTYDMWLAFVPLALVAALAALTLAGPARQTAIVYLTTAVAGVIGFTYILWSDLTYTLDTHQSSTPIPRAVGSIVLLSTLLAPLLIAPLLEETGGPTIHRLAGSRSNERGPGIPEPSLSNGQTGATRRPPP